MKRDMELAREILHRIEDCSDPWGKGMNLDFPDRTQNELAYNVKLLKEAGLIEAIDVSGSEGMGFIPQSLTNEGHDFLDAIRNDKVWGKVTEKAREHGGALPFEVLKALAIQVAKALLGLG
jgi:Hypothetical protein (DUF2513)